MIQRKLNGKYWVRLILPLAASLAGYAQAELARPATPGISGPLPAQTGSAQPSLKVVKMPDLKGRTAQSQPVSAAGFGLKPGSSVGIPAGTLICDEPEIFNQLIQLRIAKQVESARQLESKKLGDGSCSMSSNKVAANIVKDSGVGAIAIGVPPGSAVLYVPRSARLSLR